MRTKRSELSYWQRRGSLLNPPLGSKTVRTAGCFPEVERPELEAGPPLPLLSLKVYDFYFTTSVVRSVVIAAWKF